MKNNVKYINKLRKILSHDEFDKFINDKEFLIDLGCSYLETEDFKKAFKIFSLGLRFIGNDPDILNGIGVTLCELGKLNISRQMLDIALGLYPDDAITMANLAGVYWEMTDYDLAIYYYNKSIELDPEIYESHLNIINLYYEKGDLFMAYIAALNLLKVDPENQQAIEIRDDIILDLGLSVF
ncbi:MAG: tetratricopeptide repeat protein [Spirochaetes bacterium]|nr:tetratricopeptide repeat protein [Spirochaetota bacterium]